MNVYRILDDSKSFWLGLTDEAIEGEWRWLHNDVMVTFSDWSRGEPNDHKDGEDCGSFWRTILKWNDIPCTIRVKAICEKSDVEF